jgi:hypothetical protein
MVLRPKETKTFQLCISSFYDFKAIEDTQNNYRCSIQIMFPIVNSNFKHVFLKAPKREGGTLKPAYFDFFNIEGLKESPNASRGWLNFTIKKNFH